jgi:hypothetical protein
LAYTLGAITTRVQQRIRDTGFSSSEIQSYINDTQRDIFNEYRLPFMEDSQTYTTAVGVTDITNGSGLPTNYVQALDLLDSSGKLIPNVDVRELDQNMQSETTSADSPICWYYFEETINVYPAPTSAYDLTLRYYKKPTELTADENVPEVPSEFEEILVVGAAYRVMQVKDNYDQAGILQNKYDEILDKLVQRYSQAQVGKPTVMRINRYATSKTSF